MIFKHFTRVIHYFFLVLFLSSVFACGPKCERGYDREDGDCVCPPGRFIVGDSCLALANNQFFWPVDCDCLSGTFLVKLVPVDFLGTQILEFQLQDKNTTTSVYNLTGGTVIDTISTGASLSNDICTVQNKNCFVRFEGKLVHQDTLRGKLVYRWNLDPSVVVQECPTQMWRK